jgi:hypothetical protein
MEAEEPVPLLLQLPEPCLLVILQLLEHDPDSLCAAARAHSRLRQVALIIPRHIKAVVNQQRLDSLLQRLSQHSSSVQVASIHLRGTRIHDRHWQQEVPAYEPWPNLLQLPSNLKMTSLVLDNMRLQMQPGRGFQGVLGSAAQLPLQQLQLRDCELLDGIKGLEAALLLLPALDHLSVGYLCSRPGFHPASRFCCLSSDVIQQLQRLTFLEICGTICEDSAQAATALRPLSALTNLQDLRLCPQRDGNQYPLTASMVLGLHHLTRMELSRLALFEPAALAGKTLLQHLQLATCRIPSGSEGTAQLLSQLQHLQQLTYLDLGWLTCDIDKGNPPVAAFSALTASSKLRHLDLDWLILPAGVWQHVFPAGKLLPQLSSLSVAGVRQPSGKDSRSVLEAEAPTGAQLISCCPGLEYLDMQGLRKSAGRGVLAPLQGLSSLRTLLINPAHGSGGEELLEVCKLTGLRELKVECCRGFSEGMLQQLTQLQLLTSLSCRGRPGQMMVFESKVCL